jgi:hypothetical protein
VISGGGDAGRIVRIAATYNDETGVFTVLRDASHGRCGTSEDYYMQGDMGCSVSFEVAHLSSMAFVLNESIGTPRSRLGMHRRLSKSPLLAGSGPASATYSHASNHASNFGQVRVKTNPAYSNKIQMQAAGFVEGYVTAGEETLGQQLSLLHSLHYRIE